MSRDRRWPQATQIGANTGGCGAESLPRRVFAPTQVFDSFVDSFAGRPCETPGDAGRRTRHSPNTGETPRHAMRCTETRRMETLNPKVQGSTPCASTIGNVRSQPVVPADSHCQPLPLLANKPSPGKAKWYMSTGIRSLAALSSSTRRVAAASSRSRSTTACQSTCSR
jgi:hypothetical protein